MQQLLELDGAAVDVAHEEGVPALSPQRTIGLSSDDLFGLYHLFDLFDED